MPLAGRLRDTWDMVLLCLLLAIPLGICVFSLVGAARYGSEIYRAYVSSTDWRATQATVVKVSVAQDCGGGRYGSSHSLNVLYTYEVANQRYSSDRLWFGNGLCSGKAEVESRMNSFPIGARMFVYYNPRQPSQSVLYRGTVENGTVFLFTFLTLLGSGCAWWLAKLLLRGKSEKSATQQLDAYLRSRYEQYDVATRQKVDG